MELANQKDEQNLFDASIVLIIPPICCGQGINVKAKDKSGRTAMQYACNEATAEFLESALRRVEKYRETYEINVQASGPVPGNCGIAVLSSSRVADVRYYSN